MNVKDENENVQKDTRFEVITGKRTEDKITKWFTVGEVLTSDRRPYYVLKLWMFGHAHFYVVKNRDNPRFTVFATKLEDESGLRFQRPVGGAWIPGDLKTHLEMKFRFPEQTLYMSLYPST